MRFRSKSEAFFYFGALIFLFLVMVRPVEAANAVNSWVADYDATGVRYDDPVAACAVGIHERNKVNTIQYAFCNLGTTTILSNGVDTQCIGGANMTCTSLGVVSMAHQRGICPIGEAKSGVFPNEVCSCVAPQVRNDQGVCGAPVCPHQYLGQNVSDGWGLTTNNISNSYNGCDSYGCSVQVNKISTVFGVSLARQFALSTTCTVSTTTPASPLTVTLQQTDPQVVDYDAVVEKAAALDAAKTAAEKEVVDRLKADMKKSEDDLKAKNTELTTAVTEQQQAAKNLSDAATKYLQDPSPANLQSFEAFKAEYAAKSAASRYKLTQATSTWKTGLAKRRDAELLKTEAEAQKVKVAELETAIQKSGAPYDPAQVQAAKGDTAALDSALAAAAAQQAALGAQIDAMNAALNAMIAKMNGFGQAVEEAIRRMLEAGAPPPPPEEPPVDTSPVEPPTPDFCTTNPNDPTCATAAPVTGGALPTLNGSWYTKKYPSGLGGVMSNNFNTMKATPLFTVISDIVPTIYGSAHTGCFTIEIWRIGTQQLCIPQIVMQALGVFMLLTAVFAARAIIFGG